MADALRPLTYGPLGAAPEGLRQVLSPLPFAETVAALKRAIEAEGLWVLQEIDPEQLLAREGLGMLPARQILFFHPRFMARLLEGNPGALLEAPLKIAVLQLPGGDVLVRRAEVASAFARHPRLTALGLELEAIGQRVLTTALGS